VTAISEVRFRPYSKKTLFGSKKFSFVANKKLIKKIVNSEIICI